MTAHTIREERERAIQALAKEYPKTFFVVAERRKPLKHDIEKDIKADLAKDNDSPLLDYDIDDAVAWYTSHVGYFKVCSVAGTNRIDLQGRPVSKITPSEAREAEKEAEEIFAQIAARKQEKLPQFVTQSALAPKIAALPVNAALSNIEMLAELEKQIGIVRTVFGDSPDDPLRRELARPALRLMIDELNTIVARLDGG
jgi:sRNA-binding protein